MASVAATKRPGSPVAGRATVLVFPDLNTGNTTYKAVQRSAGKTDERSEPRALVEDIVHPIALTAIQAAGRTRDRVLPGSSVS